MVWCVYLHVPPKDWPNVGNIDHIYIEYLGCSNPVFFVPEQKAI